MNRTLPKLSALLLLACILLHSSLAASAAEGGVQIGQKAPDFALPDETGKLQRLAQYRGRTVVLMFYPKDFTPG